MRRCQDDWECYYKSNFNLKLKYNLKPQKKTFMKWNNFRPLCIPTLSLACVMCFHHGEKSKSPRSLRHFMRDNKIEKKYLIFKIRPKETRHFWPTVFLFHQKTIQTLGGCDRGPCTCSTFKAFTLMYLHVLHS